MTGVHSQQIIFFMFCCVLLLTLKILKIHFISDLSAHNVYFQSHQLLLTPAITFHPPVGDEKLLLRPETGVKSWCIFTCLFFAFNFTLK